MFMANCPSCVKRFHVRNPARLSLLVCPYCGHHGDPPMALAWGNALESLPISAAPFLPGADYNLELDRVAATDFLYSFRVHHVSAEGDAIVIQGAMEGAPSALRCTRIDEDRWLITGGRSG